MNIDKSRMKDEKGRYIVQGLFLEDRYNTDLAMYTWAGEDKEYNGQVFPSLKKLYLEEGDPEEYLFASKYCYDWPHWQRICKNSILSKHIAEWREELVINLRAEGVATLIDLAINDKSYQAAKWLADEGFIKKTRGRPSEAEIKGELQRQAKVHAQFKDGVTLLEEFKKKG